MGRIFGLWVMAVILAAPLNASSQTDSDPRIAQIARDLAMDRAAERQREWDAFADAAEDTGRWPTTDRADRGNSSNSQEAGPQRPSGEDGTPAPQP